MLVSEFDYSLPEELIAQHPAKRREMSRLLVLNAKNADIGHYNFYELCDLLKAGDLLVLNNTKVFPARLFGYKEFSGGKVELLLNRQMSEYDWQAIGKGLKIDARIKFNQSSLEAVVLDKKQEAYIIRFNLSHRMLFEELEKIGHIPLPPYIKRDSKDQKSKIKISEGNLIDKERYQTVYAKERGSVAAPTAGLHFTQDLLGKLHQKGVQITYITLHVGLGTFAAVKTEQIEDHHMHKEFFSISRQTLNEINQVKGQGGRIIAVGTTSCRVLESVFNPNMKKSLSGIEETEDGISGSTEIFIYPPYKFQAIDGLITNFHLPKSTLLMLVSALAGQDAVKKAYQEAINKEYRFFSYGDAMLII